MSYYLGEDDGAGEGVENEEPLGRRARGHEVAVADGRDSLDRPVERRVERPVRLEPQHYERAEHDDPYELCYIGDRLEPHPLDVELMVAVQPAAAGRSA